MSDISDTSSSDSLYSSSSSSSGSSSSSSSSGNNLSLLGVTNSNLGSNAANISKAPIYVMGSKEYSNGTFISKVLDTYNSNNYKIKEIGIDNSKGIYELYIRGSKENAKNNIWTEWKRIYIENNVVTNDIEFEDYRFFQFKVILLSKDSKIKISYIDLEVK